MSEGANSTKLPGKEQGQFTAPLQLRLGVLSWSLVTRAGLNDPAVRIEARGRFEPARMFALSASLHVPGGHELTIAEVDVTLARRGSLPNAVTGIGTLLSDIPATGTPHGLAPHASVSVVLEAEAFDRLLTDLERVGPMRMLVKLDLTDALLRWVDTDRGRQATLEPSQQISGITWGGCSVPHDRPATFVLADVRAVVQHVLDGASWSTYGWLYAQPQFQRVAAEVMVSAWLRIGHTYSPSQQHEVADAWNISQELFLMLCDAEWQTRRERRRLTRGRTTGPASVAAIPWQKRNLEADYVDGVDSRSFVAVTKDDLSNVAFRYLSGGFDSPTLEWIVTDAVIYAEVNAFGESIKQGPFVDLASYLDYRKAGGNIRRMTISRMQRRAPLLLFGAALFLGVPGWFAWQEMAAGNLIGGGLLLAGGFIGWALWPKLKAMIGFTNADTAAEGRRRIRLLSDMVGAYRTVALDRPPSDVLRTLQAVGDSGAAWDGAALSLLVAATQRNAVVWSRRAVDSERAELCRSVERWIADAAAARVTTGETRVPDFDAEDILGIWHQPMNPPPVVG